MRWFDLGQVIIPPHWPGDAVDAPTHCVHRCGHRGVEGRSELDIRRSAGAPQRRGGPGRGGLRSANPAYLPPGSVLEGAYLLLPSHLTMFPAVTEPQARSSLTAADRRRPVALRCASATGEFIVYVSAISHNAVAGDPRDTHPFGLESVSGTLQLSGATEFAVRRGLRVGLPGKATDADSVTSLTWQARNLRWRGPGEVVAARITVAGTISEAELVRIANSVP